MASPLSTVARYQTANAEHDQPSNGTYPPCHAASIRYIS